MSSFGIRIQYKNAGILIGAKNYLRQIDSIDFTFIDLGLFHIRIY